MEEKNVWQIISIDPLFIAYCRLARENCLSEPSSQAHTGKVLGKIGRYTILSHCFIDSLIIALNDLPKTCWQLVIYLARNINGIGRNRNGDPKLYIKYKKPTELIKKAKIKGIGSFYKAIKILIEKRIVFIKDENLYLNMFPLTWNIENENDKNEIIEIIQNEIEKVNNSN